MKLELWMFKLSELISTIKMRLLNFCDTKDCWNKCEPYNCRYCYLHAPDDYWLRKKL